MYPIGIFYFFLFEDVLYQLVFHVVRVQGHNLRGDKTLRRP